MFAAFLAATTVPGLPTLELSERQDSSQVVNGDMSAPFGATTGTEVLGRLPVSNITAVTLCNSRIIIAI